jgi:hypothetical protein
VRGRKSKGCCDGGGGEDKVKDVEKPVEVEIKNEMVTTLKAKVKAGRKNWDSTFDNPTCTMPAKNERRIAATIFGRVCVWFDGIMAVG